MKNCSRRVRFKCTTALFADYVMELESDLFAESHSPTRQRYPSKPASIATAPGGLCKGMTHDHTKENEASNKSRGGGLEVNPISIEGQIRALEVMMHGAPKFPIPIMTTPKLLPCPFCGREAIIMNIAGGRCLSIRHDSTCFMRATVVFDFQISEWNTRATSQPAPEVKNHSGDCTIYSALINGRAVDGICTCGYGRGLVRERGDWSEMYSQENIDGPAPADAGLKNERGGE